MRLALRNLTQDKTRLVLSVIGVALAVMLILFLLGLRAGTLQAVVAYLDHEPGSVAVMPQGIKNTVAGSVQRLPASTVAAVASVDGVSKSTPVQVLMTGLELHGKVELVRLVGYDPALGGGPWKLTAGREPADNDEVVLDRSLAGRHNLTVGNSFAILGRQVKVVGLSSGTDSLVGAFVFARASLIESFTLAPGAASFVLVVPAAGIAPADLIARLQAVPGTNVLLKRSLIANDQQISANILNQIIVLMVAVAFVVGALVVGMIIYTATIERRSEYGILKAIGARNALLYRVVAWQAAVAALLGALVGVAFAFFLGGLVTALRPQLVIAIQPAAIALTMGAGFVMALLGGLVPARAAARLAPAEVFRR
jgi:putative ABC transport system permease protein